MTAEGLLYATKSMMAMAVTAIPIEEMNHLKME